jgi:hypothetical protein
MEQSDRTKLSESKWFSSQRRKVPKVRRGLGEWHIARSATRAKLEMRVMGADCFGWAVGFVDHILAQLEECFALKFISQMIYHNLMQCIIF